MLVIILVLVGHIFRKRFVKLLLFGLLFILKYGLGVTKVTCYTGILLPADNGKYLIIDIMAMFKVLSSFYIGCVNDLF